MTDPADIRSAIVVLRPAAGRATAVDPAAPVTAATVAAVLPEPSALAAVRDWFTARGFEVTAVHATSMAIQGPARLFASVLGRAPEPGRSAAASGESLPLDRLPPQVSAHVVAVGVPKPPEFGPPP
jgi:hypothetical protein